MKNKKTLTFWILAGFFPLTCLAGFSKAEWSNYKDISGTSGEVSHFVVDDEIFSLSKKDLSDLRIVSENDQEIPYKILVANGTQKKTVGYPASLINNSYIPGQSSSVIIDLGKSGELVNNLQIATSNENFRRNVRVSGGNDMQNWNILKDGAYIYDYTDQKGNFKSQNTRISFPESTFRYLKLEVFDENSTPFNVRSIVVSKEAVDAEIQSSREVIFSTQENQEKKITELSLDLGQSGIPAGRLSFSVAGDNFNRSIFIYSSEDKKNWQLIGQDYFFRYRTAKFSGEKLEVVFPESNSRHLKIEVINRDDLPLVFSKIRAFAFQREVVFPIKSGEKYRVFYGNQKALAPQYDLDKYFQYLEVNSAGYASLSSQKNNPDFVPEKVPEKPLSERIPWLLSVSLTLASLVLIFMVYRFMKK